MMTTQWKQVLYVCYHITRIYFSILGKIVCVVILADTLYYYDVDFLCDAEFWKQIPPNEPYRVILGDVRDRLYQTRERSRHLLANGFSDIPEDATFTNVEEVHSFLQIYFENS